MAFFRGDKVVLTNTFGKLNQIGNIFEIADITTNNKIIIRDATSKIAIAAIDVDDLEKYFRTTESVKNIWTKWNHIIDCDDSIIGIYRTNFKKVEVRVNDSKGNRITGRAFCCKDDTFNLAFGIRLAYMRAIRKAYTSNKEDLLHQVTLIKLNIHNIDQQINKMCEG